MRRIKRINKIITFILFVNDFVIINLCFIFAYWLRFSSGLFPTPLGIPSFSDYIHASILTSFLIFMSLNFSGLYNINNIATGFEEKVKLFKSINTGFLLLLGATFFYRGFSYSRGLFVLVWIFSNTFLLISRHLWDRILVQYRKRGFNRKNVLVVSDDRIPVKLIKVFQEDKSLGVDIKGVVIFGSKTKLSLNGELSIFHNFEGLKEAFNRFYIDEVIIASWEIPRSQLLKILVECEKHLVYIKFVADLLSLVTVNSQVQNIAGLNILSFRETPLDYLHNRILKRLFDIGGSLCGCILGAPLMVIIAILIKLDSPKGTIFYKQKRIGEDGRIFTIYKFRTMIPEAEKHSGPVFAQQEDARCTRIGRFLRKYNLDELPQFFNVLIGDMSLVGPRPERPYFVKKFTQDIPRYMSRHKIKSGITGWAQVNGLRQNTPIEERVKYDLYYIENWSLWFDIKIIFKTFLATRNAY